jgi:hypothetical protein
MDVVSIVGTSISTDNLGDNSIGGAVNRTVGLPLSGAYIFRVQTTRRFQQALTSKAWSAFDAPATPAIFEYDQAMSAPKL